jgi:hypothetical protein
MPKARPAWASAVHGQLCANEHRYRAHEATAIARAVTRRMWALQEVLLAGVIHRRCIAAVGRVRTWAVDGIHHVLHGVAPLVAAGHGDTTQVALAGILELLGARRAQHMPHAALHKVISKCVTVSRGKQRRTTHLEDGWFQREVADAALQHMLIHHEITDHRRS